MNFTSTEGGPPVVNLATGLDFAFNFGVSVNDGFYVDTTNKSPMSITVNATPSPGQSFSGQFGYFSVNATPDVVTSRSGNPTEFVGTFTIGVEDSSNPTANALPYQEIAAGHLDIVSTLQATGQVDLSLATTKFGITTVLDVAWDFAATDPNLAGSQPRVEFRRIGTNWAQSLADFLGPNLERVFAFLDAGALGDILDFIEKPLPVVDFFVSNATTIDFLGLLATASGNPAAYPLVVGFFDTLEFFRNVYRSLPSAFDPQYDLKIDQGSFLIQQDLRPLTSLSQISTSSLQINNTGVSPFIDQVFVYETDPKNKNFTTEEDGGTISGKFTNQLALGFENASLTLPFFQDPDTVKLMLLGRAGDLVRLITPSLGVYLQGTVSFPVFSVAGIDLNVVAEGSLYPSIQFGFGYDTQGLIDASNNDDPSDLKDGFFFIADQTFLDLNAEIYLGVGAGVPDVASVSIGGDLEWDSNFALKSETGDDKVHLNQFDGLDLRGDLQLGGQIVLTSYSSKKTINIVKPITLFQYGNTSSARRCWGRSRTGLCDSTWVQAPVTG